MGGSKLSSPGASAAMLYLRLPNGMSGMSSKPPENASLSLKYTIIPDASQAPKDIDWELLFMVCIVRGVRGTEFFYVTLNVCQL